MAAASRLTTLRASVLDRFQAGLPEGPLLVALSGGADSAVCAWAAATTRPDAVTAVFVHHGFRESHALGEAAEQIARGLGIPFRRVAVDVPEIASPEAAARSVRLAALEHAASSGDWVLTGHTADDQAETVLGNLFRGTGQAGIGGIPRRRGRWVRPLLDVTRSETRELATLLHLPFRDDPANSSAEPRRNVLRREVIPDLETRFNPRLREALVRAASLADDDEIALAALAARVPLRLTDGMAKLPSAVLATVDRPVASRVARRALRHVRGPYGGEASEVDAILAVGTGQTSAATIGDAFGVWREGPWVVISAQRDGPKFGEGLKVAIPGSAEGGGLRVETWVETSPPSPWPLGRRTVVLDADAIGVDAVIRSVDRSGRIEIGTRTKRIGDALSEAGVPSRLRDAWPVMVTKSGPAWVVGVRTAAWAWCGPSTKRYLWLTHEMEEG